MKKYIPKASKFNDYGMNLQNVFMRALDPSGDSDYIFMDLHIKEFDYNQIFAFLLHVSRSGSGGPEGYGYVSLERQIAVPIYILLNIDRERFLRDLKNDYLLGDITRDQIDKMEWGYKAHGSYFEFYTDPITHKPVHRDKARFDAFFSLIEEFKEDEIKKTEKTVPGLIIN